MDVQEYILDTNDSNLAKINLRTRYPENGYAMNTKSEMVVYILTGKVFLNKNNQDIVLMGGDAVLVKTNEKYFWRPDPEVLIAIFSTPPWSSDQQVIV